MSSTTDIPTNENFLETVNALCNSDFIDLMHGGFSDPSIAAMFDSVLGMCEDVPSAETYEPAQAQLMEGALGPSLLPTTFESGQVSLLNACGPDRGDLQPLSLCPPWNGVGVDPWSETYEPAQALLLDPLDSGALGKLLGPPPLPTEATLLEACDDRVDLVPSCLTWDAGAMEVWTKYAQKRVRDGADALAVLKQSYRCQREGCCAVKITEKNTTRHGIDGPTDLVFHGMHNHQISAKLRHEMENAAEYDPSYTGGRLPRRPRTTRRNRPYAV